LLRALTQGTITLDVTASNAHKTYDGNTIVSLADLQALPGGFRVTAGNTLANGDSLPELNVAGTGIWSGTLNINGTGNTWSGARDAGIYSIVPGGLSSQKYEIVYVNGSLTIDPAVVKAVGVSGSRVYDGTRLANWNDNTQLIGVLSGDQGHVSLASGAGVLTDKNVGAQSLISLGTLALGGSAAGNYQLDTTGSSWIIQPRPVSITASQSYNGTTVADWRGNTYSLAGILHADTGLVNMASGVTELPSPDVGTYLLSSLGSLALGGSEAANYKLVTDRSAWNITPANLLISPSFTSKTYYMGQTAATGSTVQILEGQLFKGDELFYGGISFLDGNAGNNKIIKITDNQLYGKVLVDDGNFGGNYLLTVQDGRGDILPRPVDIVVSKPFDGNSNFISGFKVVNKGNDDVVVTGTATVNGTAGAYKGFKSYSLISSNKNYTVDQLEGVSAVIYDDYENPIIGYLTNINKGLNIEYVNGFQVDVGVTREAIPVHASDIVQTFGGSATILLNDGSAFDLPAYSMVAVSQGMTANSIIDQSITNETVRLSQEKFAEESRAEALREESEVNSRLSIPQRIFNILLEPFEPASRQTVSGGGVRG
jgi:hypothetical protein